MKSKKEPNHTLENVREFVLEDFSIAFQQALEAFLIGSLNALHPEDAPPHHTQLSHHFSVRDASLDVSTALPRPSEVSREVEEAPKPFFSLKELEVEVNFDGDITRLLL